MEGIHNDSYDIYKDISMRTGGEIYLGVVGSVRSGKSSFIKRFMELMVLPYMTDEVLMERTKDELPQSAAGNTVMTTEPKFIPQEAAKIQLDEHTSFWVRLIDCVGYMVDGATGHLENGVERMVKTPWSEEEIPFTQAAEIGTQKVIRDHATIGVVVTSDGSFTDISRESYARGEKRTIDELNRIGKPYIVILNSAKPYSEETISLAKDMSDTYGVSVLPLNCEQLRKEDIDHILSAILDEFPIVSMNFMLPTWVEMLDNNHPIKKNMIQNAWKIMKDLTNAKNMNGYVPQLDGEFLQKIQLTSYAPATGELNWDMDVDEKYYYENISNLTGVEIAGEYQLIELIRSLAEKRKEYDHVADALQSVWAKGYGVVTPELADIQMEEPTLIRHGNKYGVKMKASSPSIHMIRANIETEIAPIVGSEEQAKDLIEYLKDSQNQEQGVWNTNIFGKSVGELMEDGIRSKISQMDDESQLKLQDTMQKIVNDSNGGLVCIII